ncbi:MAG: methyltransferase domain-containing protein, partial [Acidobacteriota bacterium]|nr:methyltransferase domain-containing protein [Acidobacteriota bacterium]
MERSRHFWRDIETDPERLRHDVSVAINAERNLYSGAPTTIAPWLDALHLREGDRVFHVGCGTGYYTAVMAETVGASGHVIAVEIDPAIAARARENLAYLNFVEVITGDGAAIDPPESDAILIHAGVTHPRSVWLDRLRPEGRLLLPLTFEIGMPHVGKGAPFKIQRHGDSYEARLSSGPIMLYSCAGARDAEMNERLLQAFETGGMDQVRSLRRDHHEPAES